MRARLVTVADERRAQRCARGHVALIDDDPDILFALAALLDLEGYACDTFLSAVTYLQALDNPQPTFPGPCCVLCDVKMPELDGLQLQQQFAGRNAPPLLLMSGRSGVTEAVSAFRAGVVDFLVKPIDADTLLHAVAKALAISVQKQQAQSRQSSLTVRAAALTEREREIARRVSRGQINRDIAQALGIALRTVKLHRQRAMEKLQAENTADLVRIADEGNL